MCDDSKLFGDNDKLLCKHCGSARLNKNGTQGNKQVYYCRDCQRTFREGDDKRVKHPMEQLMRVILSYLEGVGIRSIGRIEKIHNTVVLSWVRKIGKIIKEKFYKLTNDIPDGLKKEDIIILECDEIVTFLKKNPKMGENIFLCGLLLTGTETRLLILK